jgi:hypothetical protein
MKFKDKTKGGYPVRLVIPEIVNSQRCSVWAVTFLGKEEFFIYDTLGYVMGENKDNIFNLVPDADSHHDCIKEQDDSIDARLCKLEDETKLIKQDIHYDNQYRAEITVEIQRELCDLMSTIEVQQDDIDSINRELGDRLDPTIVDVNQLKDDLESLQTEVSEFRGEQNAMFTNLMDNNQDISELKHEIALMKKMVEQTVDVDKMGTELSTFNKIKAGLDEMVEDSQRYKEERWGQCQEEMVDRPNFAVEYEARYWVRDEVTAASEAPEVWEWQWWVQDAYYNCGWTAPEYYTEDEAKVKFENSHHYCKVEESKRRRT